MISDKPLVPIASDDDSKYKVVREDTYNQIENGINTKYTTGYDKQGRVVLKATYKYYSDGTKGHCVRFVNKDGYWEGGAYDPQIGISYQFPHVKFEG